MGLSSSSVRLLSLTDRKNTIGCELSILSNQKMALAMDMQKVSKKYNESLNSKVYKLSNNNGVDYIDLSYNNMMRPNSNNKNKPYLITDLNERVIIDDSYLEYAKMLSADGTPSSWSGDTRLKILSELTGVSTADIENHDIYDQEVIKAKNDLNALGPAPQNLAENTSTLEDFIGKLGNNSYGATFENGNDWSEIYRNGTLKVNDANGLKNVIDGIKNGLSNYFTDENYEKFIKACDNVKVSVDCAFKGEDTNSPLVKYEDNKYIVYARALVDEIFGAYVASGGTVIDNKVAWVDKTDPEYNNWLTEKSNYETAQSQAQEAYKNAINSKNALFTAEQESMLDFYDELFSTIAEKGWTHDNNINNEDYLNQLLQNNYYTITTVTREATEDENGNIVNTNSYNTTIASNFDSIIQVNDDEIRENALVEYEYQKSIISAKETKIDLRMENLKTEENVIKTEMESIEKQMQENIERTMNIFG